MRYATIVSLLLIASSATMSQSITNTLKNFSRSGNTYTFEMWSQASQSGMSTNQALFQVNVTSGAFTVSGSTVTLESKFSSFGPGSLALVTSGGIQRFQFSFGGSSLPGIEISSAEGGEKVLTLRIKIIDTTKTSGISWVTANGWYWLTNLWAGSDNSPLPVQLSSFTVRPIDGTVRLTWTTISEIDNYGFCVERGNSPDELTDAKDGFVPGHNTTLEAHEYTWTDTAPVSYYRLRQIDLNGSAHFSDVVSTGTTGVKPALAEGGFGLAQNYPNPFNPSTTIRYGLPARSHVMLAVFNTLGQQVALLQNGEQDAGHHEAIFNAQGLPSGMYFYRLQVRASESVLGRDSRGGVDVFVESKRLLLIR